MEYILLTGRQGHGAKLLEQVTGKWEVVSYPNCPLLRTRSFCSKHFEDELNIVLLAIRSQNHPAKITDHRSHLK